MLKCGIYEAVITPELGMEMPGYFSLRNATGIKEELCTEVVYFENDGVKAVLISNDTIQFPKEYCDRAREVIASRLEIPGDKVFICCTHTHTGGPVETWGDYVHLNEKYMAFVIGRMADAAVCASVRARDVKVSYAKGFEDKIAYYRNYVQKDGSVFTNRPGESKPFGTIDPEVGVFRIDNADGTPYGVIVNYACHCDCVGGTEFSSDYPGAMRETLRKLYGEAYMPVFVNGFCGNINHCDPNGFHNEVRGHYKRMGRMLAADVARTLELAVDYFEDTTVASAFEVMEIDSRIPDADLVKWADEILATDDAGHQDKFYAREIKNCDARGVIKQLCPVQVLRIGDMAFFGMPGEIYVEFGKMLKERSPIKYNMPANLANGCLGYIPIRELFLPTVYEAKIGISSNLIPDGGYMMVDRLVELAEKIK